MAFQDNVEGLLLEDHFVAEFAKKLLFRDEAANCIGSDSSSITNRK